MTFASAKIQGSRVVSPWIDENCRADVKLLRRKENKVGENVYKRIENPWPVQGLAESALRPGAQDEQAVLHGVYQWWWCTGGGG
ncbi:hypothetical protein V1477_003138 [Vespula maculifrons]